MRCQHAWLHTAADADAIIITVPDVDVTRFREAFTSDSAAHRRLLSGSVTTTEHILILVADNDDRDLAHRLIDEACGNWNAATIAFGRREVVPESPEPH